jgi:CelD/BcsL family acetyltransferase involved in cellulose biosynthesis
METADFHPCRQKWDRAGVVEMDGDWETYWQSRSPKWRKGIRRFLRRIEEAGRVEFVRYRPKPGDDPRLDLYDACVETARTSWQGESADGTTLSHPAVADFLREMHEVAVACGAVDLCLLKLDGRPVAFAYSYHHQGRLFGLRMGFDPEVAQLGAGRVLQHHLLRDSFERGDQYFDLGVGSLDAKRYWLTSVVTSYRATSFPPRNVRAQLLRLKRWCVERRFGQEYFAGGKRVKQTA